MRRIEAIRLYPAVAPAAALEHALHVTRHLYNSLLEQRREAWKRRGIKVTTRQQYRELTELRAVDQRIAAICKPPWRARADVRMPRSQKRCKPR